MNNTNIITILKFDPNDGVQDWNASSMDGAASAGAQRHPGTGAISYMVGNLHFAQMFPGEDPYEIPVDPGPRPLDAPLTAAASYAAQHWESRQKDLKEHRAVVAALKAAMLASLPMEVIIDLTHPQTGLHAATPTAIWLHMQTKYSVTSVHDDRRLLAALNEKYTGAEEDHGVAEHIAKLRKALRTIAGRNGADKPMADKVNCLIASVHYVGFDRFNNVIELFDRDFHTTATQTFDTLAERLITEEKRLRSSRTTGSVGFGNSISNITAAKPFDKTTPQKCGKCGVTFTAFAEFDKCKTCHDVWRKEPTKKK